MSYFTRELPSDVDGVALRRAESPRDWRAALSRAAVEAIAAADRGVAVHVATRPSEREPGAVRVRFLANLQAYDDGTYDAAELYGVALTPSSAREAIPYLVGDDRPAGAVGLDGRVWWVRPWRYTPIPNAIVETPHPDAAA